MTVEPDVIGFLGVQTPRLALRSCDQPRPPAPIAIRLAADELDPRKRARVVDDVRRR
jgi:hypothetical protein